MDAGAMVAATRWMDAGATETRVCRKTLEKVIVFGEKVIVCVDVEVP